MSKEQVAIVDENDNVIATKPREELMPTDIIRISLLWVENSQGEVLLQQRALTKKIGPGQWGPAAAGTVEAHETYLTNLLKEAEEEIGLTQFTPTEVGKQLYWEPDGQLGRMFMFYKTTVDRVIDEFTIKQDEVAQLQWVAKAAVLADTEKYPKKYVPSAVFWEKMFY